MDSYILAMLDLIFKRYQIADKYIEVQSDRGTIYSAYPINVGAILANPIDGLEVGFGAITQHVLEISVALRTTPHYVPTAQLQDRMTGNPDLRHTGYATVLQDRLGANASPYRDRQLVLRLTTDGDYNVAPLGVTWEPKNLQGAFIVTHQQRELLENLLDLSRLHSSKAVRPLRCFTTIDKIGEKVIFSDGQFYYHIPLFEAV